MSLSEDSGNTSLDRPASTWDLDSIDALLTTTRSVRRRLRLDIAVDPRLIRECIELALQAPMAGGREVCRWVIVEDAAVRQELGRIYRAANSAYIEDLRARGEAGDIAAMRSWRSGSILTERLGQVPMLVALAFERHAWWDRDPYGEASTYGSVYPAAWSFQLACRSRGLVSCGVTAHIQRAREISEALGLPSHFEHAVMFAVGHPDGDTFRPARRSSVDDLIAINRWPSVT